MPTEKSLIVFRRVLDLGAERLYSCPVELSEHLDSEPAKTLYLLSSSPETFGDVSSHLKGEARRLAMEQLLTAATAYVRASRKSAADPTQLTLGLNRQRS